MSKNEEHSPQFIIGSRHAGLTLLTSIKGYASVLQNKILGEISEVHRKALQDIIEYCEAPWESWIALTELIEQKHMIATA